MHLQLYQLIAYRDGALDTSEREKVEAHLLECADCRARYAAFEHLALGLKDYFNRHRPAKGKNCPDMLHWRRYLSGDLDASEQEHWKTHLRKCDYCFDIAASFTKETKETALEPLRPPEWLSQQVEASEVSRQRSPMQKRFTKLTDALGLRWTNLAPGLREICSLRSVSKLRFLTAHLVAPPRWAYAVASVMIILFASLVVWWQLPSSNREGNLVELPGEAVQLAEETYQLLVPSEQVQHVDLPESPLEWQRWYNSLTGDEQPRSVVALLTPPFAEVLRTLSGSPQAGQLERLKVELKAQVIELPSSPIGGVLVERTLAEQLLGGTYSLNQHLLITFHKTDKTVPQAQTILKIETAR